MNEITRIAIQSERDSYNEGAKAGFWRGFSEGAGAQLDYIMGWNDAQNPFGLIPVRFKPLGVDYYPINYANDNQ